MRKDYLGISGRNFVVNGEKITLRGFGVGSWMNLEHFMIGMPGADRLIRRTFAKVLGEENAGGFFDRFLLNFLQEDDFLFLRSLGVNMIRLPFNYTYFIDDQDPSGYRDDGFRYLDHVIGLCEKHRIYAILDMHAAPGGQNPDWHSDNVTGIPQFWHYRVFREQMTGLWRHIAEHYRDNPWVAYDILNEPFFIPDKSILFAFYGETIAAIREVDRDHVIFLEGDHFAMDFDGFPPPQDSRVTFEFHYYPQVWDATVMEKEREDRRIVLKQALAHMLDIREKYNIPLWCGEFGCVYEDQRMDFYTEFLQDTIDVFEEEDISWALWAYKDSKSMGIVYPDERTAWMALVSKIRAKWNLPDEMQEADALLDLMGKTFFEPLDDDLKYALQFRLRALMQDIYTSQILAPRLRGVQPEVLEKMADAFLYRNCRCRDEIAALIKGYTGY